MKLLFLLPCLLTSVFALNPQTFFKFGDTIYNKVQSISNLKKTTVFQKDIKKIDAYIELVSKTKIYGFNLETKHVTDQNEYLKKLRKLSKQNDYFLRSVKNYFFLAIEKEDSLLFDQMLNTGLLDIFKYKEEILNYYYQHTNQIQMSTFLKQAIYYDQNLKDEIKSKISIDDETKIQEEKNLLGIRNQLDEKSVELQNSIKANLVNTKN